MDQLEFNPKCKICGMLVCSHIEEINVSQKVYKERAAEIQSMIELVVNKDVELSAARKFHSERQTASKIEQKKLDILDSFIKLNENRD